MRNSRASAGATSARAAPVTQSPSASMRRMDSSRLEAAVFRKVMSRAGSWRAPPASSTFRSSAMRAAARSLGAMTSSGRSSFIANAASRCARWASSGPYAEQTPGSDSARASSPKEARSSIGSNRQFSFQFVSCIQLLLIPALFGRSEIAPTDLGMRGV